MGWTICCDGAPDVIALIAVFLNVFILNKLPVESSLVVLLTERGDESESIEKSTEEGLAMLRIDETTGSVNATNVGFCE